MSRFQVITSFFVRLSLLLTTLPQLAFAESSTAVLQGNENVQSGVVIVAMLITLIAVICLIGFGLYSFRLKRNYKQLEQKLHENTLSLAKSEQLVKKTKETAEKSGHEKMNFLARISHEIRTPMNGILGMAEALSFSPLNTQQQNLLSSLDHSAKDLLSLLNDVLDFSKMNAGKLTLERVPTSIPLLAKNIIDNFKHRVKSRDIKINLVLDEQMPHHYHTDPTRLNQVLNNLVDNAIKFTEKGFVTLVIEQINTEAQDETVTVKFSVIDTGIGISEEQQQQLFSPFIQADADTTRKFGGTGLGLTICQEIIRAMGGEVSISSTKAKGSSFTFELALEPVSTDVKIPERRKNLRAVHAKDDQRFKDIRVLVVEDNIVNVAVITAQLNRLNINADVANDGVEALAMYKKSEYHIILSDCHMPNMDGFELAKQLSELPKESPLWLIAVTADTLNGVQEKCELVGFNDYLSKPCTQENITDVINNAYRQLQLM